jgi:hypothetical protein
MKSPVQLVFEYMWNRCETNGQRLSVVAGAFLPPAFAVGMMELEATRSVADAITNKFGSMASMGAVLAGGGMLAVASIAAGYMAWAVASVPADIAKDELGGEISFNVLSLKARAGAIVGEYLSILPKCGHLATRMKEIHAEVGDKGESYLVTFTTNKGDQATITGMTPDEFKAFRARVAGTNALLTVTSVSEDGVTQTRTRGGKPVTVDPQEPSDWTVARREVRYEDLEGVSIDEVLSGDRLDLARDTYFTSAGEELSKAQLAAMRRSAPEMTA